MNLLILGDSLSFPRFTQNQLINDAWPQILTKELSGNLKSVWFRSVGRATSQTILNEIQKFSWYVGYQNESKQFDYVICQFGIVDCIPRAYPLWFETCFRKIPFGIRVISLLNRHHYKLSILYGLPWISNRKWIKNIKLIIEQLNLISKNIIFIKICHTNEGLASKSYNVENKIDEYNGYLEEIIKNNKDNVFLLDNFPKESIKSYLLDDGHHLTIGGHKYVAEKILKILEK